MKDNFDEIDDNYDPIPSDVISDAMCEIQKKLNPNTYRAYSRHIIEFSIYLDENRIFTFNNLRANCINKFLSKYEKKPNLYNQALSAIIYIIDYIDANEYEIPHYIRIKSHTKRKKIKSDAIEKLTLSRFKLLKARDNAYGIYSDRSLLMRNLLLFDLAMHTMMRCDELAQIKLGDIDLSEGRIYVRGKGGITDDNGQRSVTASIPITDKLMQDIKTYIHQWRYRHQSENRKPNCDYPATINPEAPLFVSKKKCALSKSAINQIASEIISTLFDGNVPKNHAVHCIRRTMAKERLKAGKDLATIQKLLRHANVHTTMRYLDIEQEEIDKEFLMCSP